jgi:hypothetical protein
LDGRAHDPAHERAGHVSAASARRLPTA